MFKYVIITEVLTTFTLQDFAEVEAHWSYLLVAVSHLHHVKYKLELLQTFILFRNGVIWEADSGKYNDKTTRVEEG